MSNKIRQIELLYKIASYNICAQVFIQEKCRLHQLALYYHDRTPEKNKKAIIKFLRALKKQVDINTLISAHECLFYIFHCFIPSTYDFIEEIINIIEPPNIIIYIGIMLEYYETHYDMCKSLNCCGINYRYTILQDHLEYNMFINSTRGIWIMSCVALPLSLDK